MTRTCAWCGAARIEAAICPECGADYEKAAAIRAHGRAQPAPVTAAQVEGIPEEGPARPVVLPEPPTWPVPDPEFERKCCIVAFPAMLLGAWLVQYTGVFAGMQRIMLGMPVHELGHAVTAWFSGFNAIPTVWVTVVADRTGWVGPGLLALGIGAIGLYGLRRGQRLWMALAGCLWLLQIVMTSVPDEPTRRMLITFGGDGVGMVLATALMCTFYVGKDTQIYQGALRWGFVFIGAAAFMDMFMGWWRGQTDRSEVGYGTTGGGFTDAYKLINFHGWSWDEMIGRHLAVGYACMLVMAIVYVLGLRQVNRWVAEKRDADRLDRLRSLQQRAS